MRRETLSLTALAAQLSLYFHRWTVVERPWHLELVVPHWDFRTEDLRVWLEENRPLGLKITTRHLPWWKNWFRRHQVEVGAPLPPEHFNCRCHPVFFEEEP